MNDQKNSNIWKRHVTVIKEKRATLLVKIIQTPATSYFCFSFSWLAKKFYATCLFSYGLKKKFDSGGGQDRDQGGAREVRLTVQYIDGPTRFNQAVGAKQFVTSMKQHRAEIQLH